MYEGNWLTTYLSPGRLTAVDIAVVFDNIPLGTPPKFGSPAPVSSLVVSSFPGSPFADLDAAMSINPMLAKPTSADTQPVVTLHNQDRARLEYNLVAPSLLFLSPTVVEPVSSLATNFSLPAPPVIVSFKSPSDVVLAAQPSPLALTPPKRSVFQILRDRLARREEECFLFGRGFHRSRGAVGICLGAGNRLGQISKCFAV